MKQVALSLSLVIVLASLSLFAIRPASADCAQFGFFNWANTWSIPVNGNVTFSESMPQDVNLTKPYIPLTGLTPIIDGIPQNITTANGNFTIKFGQQGLHNVAFRDPCGFTSLNQTIAVGDISGLAKQATIFANYNTSTRYLNLTATATDANGKGIPGLWGLLLENG